MNYGYAAGPPRQIKDLLRYVRSSKRVGPVLYPTEMQLSICLTSPPRIFVLTSLQYDQRTILLRLPVRELPWDTSGHELGSQTDVIEHVLVIYTPLKINSPVLQSDSPVSNTVKSQ